MAPRLPLVLAVAVLASCGPSVAYISRETSQQVNDVLTEKLFAVSSLLTTIEGHVSRLDRWDGTVTGVESRLEALEASQQRVTKQLEDVLKRLESVSEDTAAVREEIASAAKAQATAASALAALGDRLVKSVSTVGESVTDLSGNLSSEHERTRGTCGGAGAELSETLSELRTAVSQATEQAQRLEANVDTGLQGIDSRLQQTAEGLGQLSQELREERQARLTTTTPRPTEDPQQAFLNSLYRSLSKRRQD